MSNAIRDDEAISAYLAGRLSDAEASAFEARIEREPTLVKTLEATLRLKEGLEVLRESGQLEGLRRAPRRSRASLVFALAAAAGVATVAVLVALQFFARPPLISASVDRLGMPGGVSAAVAAHYTFAAVRQATRPPVLDLPVGGAIEIRILTSRTGKPTTYRATLESAPLTGTPVVIGTVMHLVRDTDGFVAVYADASRLTPGDFALSVIPEPADSSAPDRFPFSLQRPPADSRPSP